MPNVTFCDRRDLVLGVSPFGEPDPSLTAAVERGGGLGVLDLGRGDGRSRAALERASHQTLLNTQLFGAIRVPAGCRISAREIPGDRPPHTVLLGPGSSWAVAEVAAAHRVLAEVTSLAAARAALAEGAHGLIARGREAGGPVGDLSTFVLLQQLLAQLSDQAPIWAWGGIGPRTAVAAVTAGAAGVVLDSQLALLAGARTASPVAAALARMDGSETIVIGGHRLLNRPGSATAALAATGPVSPADVESRLGGRDLGSDLVPIGQDGFLAADFAGRFAGVTEAVRAVRTAVLDSVTGTAAPACLMPGSVLAAALGTELPLAQGPMTRVSDQPAFAASVAAAGAMPFLALAMSTGEQSSQLLRQTRSTLGERPWGVGILGFVEPELRDAQLAAIAATPPSCVIIAGGRPRQAADLEKAGIPAFLHVPSPRLLSQFLAAGARRFVFEGAECGGHVGPQASFPLWEAQVGVITEHLRHHRDDASSLSLLFAGGIHDARSAAAVAALAEPLAELGAGVGLLMGTAYLFTDEAVRDGAIGSVFQHRVLAATATELLTTAPGHSTRALPSPFTDEFRRTAEDLASRGTPSRDVWESLENLNIGRSRVASKGLARIDGGLVTLDEADQLERGLFMAGQLATLRTDRTTVGELHAAVTAGAATHLSTRRAEISSASANVADPAPAPAPADVAIVGMACVFPQAPDLPTYWANILHGVDAVTEVPAERWSAEQYYAADDDTRAGSGRSPSKWGGFLPRIGFDPLRYGIPPASLPSIDPGQLLALDVARSALEDAGYGEESGRPLDRARTGVVFAAEAGGDLFNAYVLRTTLPGYLGALPADLDRRLPTLTEDSFPGTLANVLSGRIANRLDLGGPTYAVDAACASSLAAVDLACKELRQGSSDVVVCGAADLHNSVNDYLLFSSVGALSPTGRSRAFDASADGITLGEGVAAVVLKRRADAERDGDRIYAVIHGVGAASDGRSLGLTAPRAEGQRRALQAAYTAAGLSPASVGLLEAHGTGTVVGDRTELRVLEELFTEAEAQPGACTLGSVKSQVGHTKCAAGMAGLIKAALAVRHAVRPPTVHLTRPNPAWQHATSPFAFHRTATVWPTPPRERIAGVSAFGFGGTNYHLVLGGHDSSEATGAATAGPAGQQWPAELFVLAARTPAALAKPIQDLLDLALDSSGRDGGRRLRDLALTWARRRPSGLDPVRLAIVATDAAHLVTLLRRAQNDPAGKDDATAGLYRSGAENLLPGAHPTASVALLFPGQGSQRPGMLADLFVAFPELQYYLRLHPQLSPVIHPPDAFEPQSERSQRERLRDTRMAQPALGITGLAMHRLLSELGVDAGHLAGHSYGELVALSVAGAFTPATLLSLSDARAVAILEAAGDQDGSMAAVPAAAQPVQQVLAAAGLGGQVVVANHNAPRQSVISGPAPLITQALDALAAAGRPGRRIPVACAFHSPMVAAAGGIFSRALESAAIEPLGGTGPHGPQVWSNRTASGYPGDPDGIRAEMAAQIGAPVRFAEQIEAMYDAGVRVFVEAGPGTVLTGLAGAVLGDRPHLAVAVDGGTGHGLVRLLHALARLAVAGVPVAPDRLVHGRGAVDLTGAAPLRRPAWTVDGHLVRDRHGNPLAGGLTPAQPIGSLTAPAPPSPYLFPDVSADPPTSGVPAPAAESFIPTQVATPAQVVTPHPATAPARSVSPQRPAAPARSDAPAATFPPPSAPITPLPLNGVPAMTDQTSAARTHSAARDSSYTVAGYDPGHDAVTLFLRLSGDLVQAQRDVLLTYLTGAASPAQPTMRLMPSIGLAPALASANDASQQHVSAESPLSTSQPSTAPQPSPAPQSSPAPPTLPAPQQPVPTSSSIPASLPDLAPTLASAPVARAAFAPSATEPAWAPATLLPAPPAAPAPAQDPATVPAPVADPETVDLLGAVLEVIAERTGYPTDMIEPDLDLEADLSIDSIKRTEIVGTLADRLVRGGDAGTIAPEMPSSIRTAAGIAGWLGDWLGVDAAPPASMAPSPAEPISAVAALRSVTSVPDPDPGTGVAPRRFVEHQVPAPARPADPVALKGARFAVLALEPDEPGPAALIAELTGRLAGHGAAVDVVRIGSGAPDPDADGVILLDLETESAEPVLPAAFGAVRQALEHEPRWMLAVSSTRERSAAGLRGFFRSVAREYPDLLARLVEVGPRDPADRVGQRVIDELLVADGVPVSSYPDDSRHSFALTAGDLGPLAAAGAGPAGPGVAEAQAAGLDRDSVILVIGGGRGVTARTALAFATAIGGGRIELAGRTPGAGEPEPPAVAAAHTRAELRATLIGQGLRIAGGIEQAASGVLARREVAATVAGLTRAGASVRYHQLDVCRPDAVSHLVKDVYAEHGRLDGVIYGAGVIADQLIAGKDPADFARVMSTKVDGGQALLTALDRLPSGERFAVMFGSIAAVVGNRGQSDYAAANDALEQLTTSWAARTGQRGLTVHWGPWQPGAQHAGMVSPELARSYQRRGVELLDPEEATACLLRELAYGERTSPAVVFTGAAW